MRQKTIGIFKDEKQPKTAAEMAAVMAYYLKELALGDEWKDSVSADDVTIYSLKAVRLQTKWTPCLIADQGPSQTSAHP